MDFDQVPVEHKAHKQAFTDLLTVLKTQAPLAGDWSVSFLVSFMYVYLRHHRLLLQSEQG